ncbi:MAG TPA: peptide deformylase [Thermoanaerobaculia bacterium]|nr:peptide deformylase [Thermoanaerobaculia bacterium]
MAILPIRIYPDPVLREVCPRVTDFGDAALRNLARDMVETMHAAPGVGLAAPQVGLTVRLAVVDLTVGKEPEELRVLVNPEVLEPEGKEVEEEGCLSIPGLLDKVERPARVRVRAQDVDGTPFELVAEGWLARAVCHEVDHLDGVLFTDRLRGLRRERAKRQLRRLAATHEVTV